MHTYAYAKHIKAAGNMISASFKAGRWLVPDSNSKWLSSSNCSVELSLQAASLGIGKDQLMINLSKKTEKM